MFNSSVLKRNTRGRNKAGKKFPRRNLKFEYTHAAKFHSASECNPPFCLFMSAPKKNQTLVLDSINKPLSGSVKNTDELISVGSPYIGFQFPIKIINGSKSACVVGRYGVKAMICLLFYPKRLNYIN